MRFIGSWVGFRVQRFGSSVRFKVHRFGSRFVRWFKVRRVWFGFLAQGSGFWLKVRGSASDWGLGLDVRGCGSDSGLGLEVRREL
jgi:hypothetical protein